jgi:predicted ATPase
VRHLLLIGAYRDNEVTAAHPLMRRLEAIRGTDGAAVQEITLAPLGRDDICRLIEDSLYCDAGRAAPLAQLVHEKSAGNPFFAIQLLSALIDEGLVTFDHRSTRWHWDLPRIHAKGYTDNVIDLMVGTLRRLPTDTQGALRHLACLGNSVDPACWHWSTRTRSRSSIATSSTRSNPALSSGRKVRTDSFTTASRKPRTR